MTRVPIRIRLTMAFAVAMACVLAGVGWMVHARLGRSLDEQLEESLRARADTLASLARGTPGGDLTGGLGAGEDGFAQVIGADGAVLAATPGFEAAPLLTSSDLARARTGPIVVDRESVAGIDGGEVRLVAAPVQAEAGEIVVVAGASLEDRREALDGLLAQLLVAGPIALALSSLAGYALAGAALRPVEDIRRRAAKISAETPGERLPLPSARDELFRLGQTLNAMLARLEAGLARERRFVADASHELRTPLATLQAELDLALRRPRSAEETERALRSAAEEVDRLVRLAEDLLVLAQADEGRLPLRRAEIVMEELLGSVARRFTRRAETSGRRLVVGSSSQVLLNGDQLHLERALGNLVDNAFRHGAGTVRLEAESMNGMVAVRVSDEGQGFPPDFLPRAFERFSRADDARSLGATGLGLTIVEAIARSHGGRVAAANLPGGGAEVTLSLPGRPSR